MRHATAISQRAQRPHRLPRAQRAHSPYSLKVTRPEKTPASGQDRMEPSPSHHVSAPVSETLAETAKSLRELLVVAKTLVAPQPLTMGQKIAAAIHKWALPVMQVLLGAAILVVGITSMDIPIMVVGATTCATGLAISITLLAGALAPHPIDRVKELLQRKQSRDPEPYEPGTIVSLDGGG